MERGGLTKSDIPSCRVHLAMHRFTPLDGLVAALWCARCVQGGGYAAYSHAHPRKASRKYGGKWNVQIVQEVYLCTEI